MEKFWNWIHDDSGGRVLRLEGPIDSESFWGDEITPQDFRDELYSEEEISRSGSTRRAAMCSPQPKFTR